MKSLISGLNIFRITNRHRKDLVEKIVGQALAISSNRRPLRGLSVLEIQKIGGSDYFVGVKMNEIEFQEFKLVAEADKLPS